MTDNNLGNYVTADKDRPVPTDHEFVFIRSTSATAFILGALNAQDGSNSSSLTSRNVSILISPQPHTRKVAGSKPAGTTTQIRSSGAYIEVRSLSSRAL